MKNALGKTVSLEIIGNLDKHKCIVKSEFYNQKTKVNETTVLFGDSNSDTHIKNTKKYESVPQENTLNSNIMTPTTIHPTGESDLIQNETICFESKNASEGATNDSNIDEENDK